MEFGDAKSVGKGRLRVEGAGGRDAVGSETQTQGSSVVFVSDVEMAWFITGGKLNTHCAA